MIRNFLYSLCLHLFMILVLYTDTILYRPSNSLNLSTNFIEISKDFIKEINNKKTTKDKNNLSLQEKVALYKTATTAKKSNVSVANYSEIKKLIGQGKAKTINVVKAVPKKIDNQVITLEHKELYVQKDKVSQEQKEIIQKQNAVKEKIRKEMPDKLEVGNKNTEKIELNSVLNDLDAKLTITSKNNEEEIIKKEVKNTKLDDLVDKFNETSKAEINEDINDGANGTITVKTTKDELVENADELMELLDTDSLEEISMLNKKVLDIDLDNMFTQEDIDKLNDLSEQKKSLFELSTREKINIQKQIRICYKNAIIKTGKNSLMTIRVDVSLARNGKINMKNISFNIDNGTNADKYSASDYDITVNNIKLALVYCNPLRNLPYSKYNTWKNMSLTFNSNL